ncbi:MAG TPA: oligosaccharide flippase family protein [Terracidiphilus sp.]|nr:oligosaccharide flippase family protein [Terracidiphilus sp.]
MPQAENRSRERYRRAAMSGAAASAGKVVSLATSILTVRLTFRYLGPERYGIFITITSIVLMLGFADLGISNGLVNLVAGAVGREDRGAAREAIASAFRMLGAIALVLAVIAAAAYPFIHAGALFNVHTPAAIHEAGGALAVFFGCFLLQLPLGVVRGTQGGLQQGYLNSLWTSFGTLLSLGAVLLAIEMRAGLAVLVLSVTGPPVLAGIMNGIELFGFSHRDLAPDFRRSSPGVTRHLLHVGVMFFLQQLGYCVGMQTDNVVIAQIMGAASVAAYAVPARLFNVVLGFLVMISVAMWPAYADAKARNDGKWIRKSFLRISIGGTAVTVLITAFLIMFGNRILHLWIGQQMQASTSLLLVLGAQCIVYAYLQPINFLLNAVGKFRVQVVCQLAMAVVNLALSILFVKRYGIVGGALGTVVSLVLVQVVPLTIVTWRELKSYDQLPKGPATEPLVASDWIA